MATQRPIGPAQRREVNNAAIRQFIGATDPAWRWGLILGLREMRANLPGVGELMAQESGDEGWRNEKYAYGPMLSGLTAAAVAECAEYCEDLFAQIKFLREDIDFVKSMMGYRAGKVTEFGADFAHLTMDDVCRLFFIPPVEAVRVGLANAEDPDDAFTSFQEALERLQTMLAEIGKWYHRYEYFHVQYKHGLKIAMRPFGEITDEALEERKATRRGPLIAFTNETVTDMFRRPPEEHVMMIQGRADGSIWPNLNQLIEGRLLLRYRPAGVEVDFDDIVALARSVLRLQEIVRENRIKVMDGLLEDGLYGFNLPGPGLREVATTMIEMDRAPNVRDFPLPRQQKSKKSKS